MGEGEQGRVMRVFLSSRTRCAPGFLGETCQFPDPCQDAQLCQNGGSCQALLPALPGTPSPPSPVTPSFFCTCPSGFTGERCQAKLNDPCSSFCSKMGHCHIQASGLPQCSCLPGWTGEHRWGWGAGRSSRLGCGEERWLSPVRTEAMRIYKPILGDPFPQDGHSPAWLY